jgi:hypothetical protein
VPGPALQRGRRAIRAEVLCPSAWYGGAHRAIGDGGARQVELARSTMKSASDVGCYYCKSIKSSLVGAAVPKFP